MFDDESRQRMMDDVDVDSKRATVKYIDTALVCESC